MSTMTADLNATVKARTEKIVADGTEVRPRLAALVSQSAWQSQENGVGLLALMRAVMDGASAGFARAVPQNRDDVLRQVVDAVGDGLSQTALAGQLAVQEAASSSRRFAKEDLVRVRDDLAAVRDLFSETVTRGLESSRTLTTGQIANAQEHAERVAKAIEPVFTRALEAVGQHPLVFAREGLQAGVSVAQGAAGSLFQALGRMLKRAGNELRGEKG